MRSAVLTLIALTFFVSPAHAQMPGTDALSITLTPAYPKPYETVAISPRSSLLDLTRATVSIMVNGETVEEGSGFLDAIATVGGAGETTTIVVTATVDGQTYREELALRPAEVALAVEPVSTTYPFYPGASLVASEGLVRFVAVTDLRTSPGAPIPPQNLSYTWRVNGSILQGSSGIGKSSLTATAPVRHRNATISVTVTSQDQSVVAEESVIVAPVDPIVRIYKTDPLLGPLFGTALKGTYDLQEDEEGFRVVPFYFAQRPAITWSVNGRASETDDDVTVRSTGGNGTARLEAYAREEVTAQSARNSISIRFGEGGFLDFFGL